MKRWMILGCVLVASVMAMSAMGARAEDPPPVFDTRPYKEARASAEKEERWFVVKATAVWCGPCKQMDKTTWRDEAVVKWLRANAVVVAVDVDREPALAKELGIEAMPTMVAFKEGREEFDRVVGYKGPEEFLGWLEGMAKGEKAIELVRRRAAPRGGGGGVDIDARYQLAESLMRERKYVESADEYVWLWEHMLEHAPSMYGVRLSYMASNMTDLAAKSPEAREKFRGLRDKAAQGLGGERVDEEAFRDWIELNKIVDEERATLEWFDKVKGERRWRGMIDRNMHALRELLKREKRYADVGRLMGDPVEALEQELEMRATIARMGKEMGEEQAEQMKGYYEQRLREECGWNYACLLAAGREKDAERLADKARGEDATAKMVRVLVESALDAGQAREGQIVWLKTVDGGSLDWLVRDVEAALKKSGERPPGDGGVESKR